MAEKYLGGTGKDKAFLINAQNLPNIRSANKEITEKLFDILDEAVASINRLQVCWSENMIWTLFILSTVHYVVQTETMCCVTPPLVYIIRVHIEAIFVSHCQAVGLPL